MSNLYVSIFLFLSAVHFTPAQLIWQNPLPTGAAINGIFFINVNTGYAAGDFGTLLKTTDGGITWNSSNSGISDHLNDVYFTDSQTGYAVGVYGSVYKTLNGGLSWFIQNTYVINHLYTVRFINPDLGIITGNGVILRTTNRGENWIKLPLPYKAYFDVVFTGPRNGMIVGEEGIIMKTTNRGETWTNLSSGVTDDLHSIAFTSITNAVAVGQGGRFLRTTDAGISWHNVPNNYTGGRFRKVCFFNEHLGFAVSNSISMHTTNGGVTWLPAPAPTNSAWHSLYFVSSTVGYAGGFNGRIMKTTNSGSTWIVLSKGQTQPLTALAFADQQNGIAVGLTGTILNTSDRGNSWHLQTSGIATDLTDVYAINIDTYFAAGDSGKIIKTTDGGYSWQTVYTQGNLFFEGIYFTSPLNGIAIGRNGAIIKTTDGGITWRRRNSGTLRSLYDINFIDQNNGWVSGSSMILKTTDGGDSWHIIYTPYFWAPGIFFVDQNLGFISGESGSIYKTTDGGDVWIRQLTLVHWIHVLYNVKFKNAENGLAVGGAEIYGSGAVIVRTTNGGEEWIPQGVPLHRPLKDIWIFDDGTEIFVGYNGAILKSIPVTEPIYNINKTVKAEENFIPGEFNLTQNYPNPFNPSTVIEFYLPDEGFTNLTIYDLLGTEIKVLINEIISEGKHRVEINAAHLPSGVYIYKLQSGKHTALKKMQLIK